MNYRRLYIFKRIVDYNKDGMPESILLCITTKKFIKVLEEEGYIKKIYKAAYFEPWFKVAKAPYKYPHYYKSDKCIGFRRDLLLKELI